VFKTYFRSLRDIIKNDDIKRNLNIRRDIIEKVEIRRLRLRPYHKDETGSFPINYHVGSKVPPNLRLNYGTRPTYMID